MQQNHYIWKLRRPLSEYDSNMVDFMIVKSNIGGHRLIVWKEGIQVFIYFIIRNRLYINLQTCKIPRQQAVMRIYTKHWTPILYNVYKTDQRLLTNNRHGIPSNFDSYPLTYFRMISIRNFQNQLQLILLKQLTTICPNFYDLLLHTWLSYIINRRRQRLVMAELRIIPAIRNMDGILIFPGGITFQDANTHFESAIEQVDN